MGTIVRSRLKYACVFEVLRSRIISFQRTATQRSFGSVPVVPALSPSVQKERGTLFFFIKTLKRNWSVEETPYPKRPIRLPDVLSREEVERLIDSADSRLHRVWLLTLYATGVRREELVRLKVSDIDSARMVLHIHQGKGNQDRDVMLSPETLAGRS
jgi:integrase/recombinase XerD